MPGWQGSQRRKTLPTNWRQLRATILKRDGHQCTWTVNGHRCTNPATDVDHRNRHIQSDDPSNLQSLCTTHHAHKTALEGNTERWRYRTKRPAEQHPGLIT
jgi:5-methylcytosine-specific restriction protein A